MYTLFQKTRTLALACTIPFSLSACADQPVKTTQQQRAQLTKTPIKTATGKVQGSVSFTNIDQRMHGIQVMSLDNGNQLDRIVFDTDPQQNSECSITGAFEKCSFTIEARSPTTDFFVTAFDSAPSNGAFTNAKTTITDVSTSNYPVDITNHTFVALSVGAEVHSLSLFSPDVPTLQRGAVISSEANGKPTEIRLNIVEFDAQGAVIMTSKDNPLKNALKMSVTEHNDFGHTMLTLNGNNPNRSVVIHQPDDATTLIYDGTGRTPTSPADAYYATVSIAIAPPDTTSHQSPPPAADAGSFDISPLFVTATVAPHEDFEPAGVTYPGIPSLIITSDQQLAPVNLVAAETATNADFDLTAQRGSKNTCTGITFQAPDPMPTFTTKQPVSIPYVPSIDPGAVGGKPCLFGFSDGAGSSAELDLTYSAPATTTAAPQTVVPSPSPTGDPAVKSSN